MAQYIDSAYCHDRFGETLTNSLTTKLGGDLASSIESATALVQSLLVGKGYSLPAVDSVPDVIKMATFGALWRALAGMPKASVKLPDDAESNPYFKILDDIESGAADLSNVLTVSTSRAIGGSQWTDTSSTSATPRRATRDELAGF